MTDPRIVWKWSMPQPVMEFDMPVGAEIICVESQHDIPTLWTLSKQSGPTERRTFLGHPTGIPVFEDNLVYVGTAHGVEDFLVFHIFERIPQ